MPNVHVPRYEVGLKLAGDENEPTLKPLGPDCLVFVMAGRESALEDRICATIEFVPESDLSCYQFSKAAVLIIKKVSFDNSSIKK